MRFTLSIGWVFGLVVACSGSDDGSAPTAVTPATQQALATALCDKAASCTSDIFVKAFYGSSATCATRFYAQAQLDTKGGGYGVTESAAAACRTALAAASCDDVLNLALPPECDFKGSLFDGSTCTADAQCQSGSCFVDDAASCGKCGARVQESADCTNANCARGLKCSKAKKCVRGAVGSACSDTADCAGLFQCKKGVCAAPLPANAACNTGGDEVPCDLTRALACVPAKAGDATGTCSAIAVAFTTIGGKCGLTSLSPLTATACENGECVDNACVAHPADGASCTPDGQRCQAPATCRNGVCALKDPTICK